MDEKEQDRRPRSPARLGGTDALFRENGLARGKHTKSPPASALPSGNIAGKIAGKPHSEWERLAGAGPVVLKVPEWKQYGWLLHGFSTRAGGVSTVYRPGARCGELNLGLTADDPHENVEANRELFLSAVLSEGGVPARGTRVAKSTRNLPQRADNSLQLLRQIHSGLVHHLAREASEICEATQADPPLRGDGAIATERGVLLAIQTADCIPVLVADVRQRIVAAFHAGWRGTLARVVERGAGRLRAEFGSLPGDLTAAIGPGIGRCCYSVGEEVRSKFRSQFHYADTLFQEVFDVDPVKEKYPMLFLTARAPGHSNLGPSLHLDLIEANRRQLMDAGLSSKAIHAMGLCTACDTTRFFSHRAEQGFTGRMLSVIGVAR